MNTNQSSSKAVQATSKFSTSDVAGPATSDSGHCILTSPYQLAAKSRLLRDKFSDRIGKSLQANGLGLNRLGLNVADVQQAVQHLGFKKVREESEEAEAPESGKLSLAILLPKNNPKFNTPAHLSLRPFVEPMHQLCSKWLLVQTMRRAEARLRQARRLFLKASGEPFSHEEFTAFTVNLNNPELETILAQKPGTYLAKPVRGTMGERQQLVHIGRDSVNSDLLQFLLSSQFLSMRRNQVILQRYIERPLLIDKRKFDLRVYYLVANVRRRPIAGRVGSSGGCFAFLHPGFVRLCSVPYDASRSDLAVHLTNQSVQLRHHTEAFAELKEATTWYPDELNGYLNRRRRDLQPNWARDVLYPKIGAILGYISALFRRQLDDRNAPGGAFRILGVDILVDADLRVHLLEFNEFPSWGRRTSVLRDIKPNVWREAICLVSELAMRFSSREPVAERDLLARQNFSMVYSSEDPQLARRNVARLYR